MGTAFGAAETGAAGTDAGAALPALPDAPIDASLVPTATVESTGTSIERSTPDAGDGISVSTLSVETSRSGSSTEILSPTFFNHRVTVPSVTDSPSAGITTEVAAPLACGAAVCAGAACATGAGGGVTGAGGGVAGVAATGAEGVEGAPALSAMSASSAPTGATLSTATRIF